MSWLLEKRHHRPCVRKGDTEDETVIVQNKTFKTKKEAIEYMNGLKNTTYAGLEENDYKERNNTLKRWFFSPGRTWINENTGDRHEEYYCWLLRKV